MKIENFLPPAEARQFHELVAQSHQVGAGGLRFYSEGQHLVVIGVVSHGELMTWFASPAHSEAEAILTERVVTSGVQLATAVLSQMQTGAQVLADEVIKKASSVH